MNENYRALTRAYRPQTFEEIISQEHVSNTLKNAIKANRLSHAYMFCGPRGVGKTTMARVLARVVNQVDETVDGEALSRTLNIVEMDAASNRKIEDVRSLKEVIRVPPQNGRYKIFIIDEVHMLTKEAFNALLKTLEEPPGHAIFIFATTEPHKVLPTILSRVQRFDFKRIGVTEIVGHLKEISEKEGVKVDDESLHVIAERADGALRDALGLLDQAIAFCGSTIEYKELLRALNVVDKEHLFAFVDAVTERNAAKGLGLVKELLTAGTDIQEFLVSLTGHIRNLYVASDPDRLELIEATEETRNQYRQQAGDYTEEDLIRMLHLVSETQQKLKDARQPRIQFEVLMLKLIHMTPVRNLDTLMNELQELKKNSTNLSEPGKSATLKGEAAPAKGEDEPAKGNSAPASSKTESSFDGAASPSGNTSSPAKSSASNPDEELFGPPSLAGASDETGRPPDKGPSRNPDDRPSRKSGRGGDRQHQNGAGKTRVKKPSPVAVSSAEAESGSGRTVSDNEHNRPAEGRNFKNLEDIRDKWDQYLLELEESVPRMLYFQIQRAELAELQGTVLKLLVDNEFGKQLIDEHQMELSRLLKSVTGVRLKIESDVQQDESRDHSTSLYDEFQKIREKDPQIQTLVELFGAELEY